MVVRYWPPFCFVFCFYFLYFFLVLFVPLETNRKAPPNWLAPDFFFFLPSFTESFYLVLLFVCFFLVFLVFALATAEICFVPNPVNLNKNPVTPYGHR